MTNQNNEPDPIEVPLGKSGLFAWIDEDDKDLLVNNWDTLKTGNKEFPQYYAAYKHTVDGKTKTFYMHNEVWKNMTGVGVPPGHLIDHINMDKLDNRRCNLRLATRTGNEANKRKRLSQKNRKKGQPSSSYKGVSFTKKQSKKPWRAVIGVRKKYISLGTYATEEEAAKAYNKAAQKHFGEFAFLNDVEEGDE